MNVELFIYWRTPSPQLPHALAALQALQRAWREAHPGLVAQVYLRQDDAAADRTLMETYAHPQGLPPALQQAILGATASELAPWCAGPRHVEIFGRVAAP